MSVVTTEPAAITQPVFSLTPATIVALAPITTSSSTITGFHLPPEGGCLSFVSVAFGPMNTLFPIQSGLEEAVAKHQIDVITKRWGEIYDNIIDSKTSTE